MASGSGGESGHTRCHRKSNIAKSKRVASGARRPGDHGFGAAQAGFPGFHRRMACRDVRETPFDLSNLALCRVQFGRRWRQGDIRACLRAGAALFTHRRPSCSETRAQVNRVRAFSFDGERPKITQPHARHSKRGQHRPKVG